MTTPVGHADRAPDATDASDAAGDPSFDEPRWSAVAGWAVPALLAYLPLLLTQRGQVGADTKTYLYLDPGRLLADAPYLWDEGVGAGTVTHQNIGYLFPMGPWYWLFETLGVPDWIAQRLWLGTVLFVAALGVRSLLRTLGWRDGGVLIASLAYMLSPYILDYEARISVILLPWAALPWLIVFTARALRTGGWRHPALFALTLFVAGGTNATALLMVAPACVLWVVWAVWVDREVDGRRALAATGRAAVLTLGTSLWWIAGLWAQGRYGLPVLRYTESYRTVAETSMASEVLRGFGYWFFYGRDKLGPWIEPNVEYTNRAALIALSYGIPALSLAAAALSRWRHRAYFLSLVVVGTLLAVGGHPWDQSSPLGALFKSFTRTDAGLALRSTPRAVPLVVLGLSVCLGAGVAALGRRVPRAAIPSVLVVAALIVVNLPPLWNGTLIANNLKRPEDIPAYWTDAAAYLDSQGDATRVLEIPGSDFASYRWGNTVDPITPGLMDRPYVARELFAYGSPQSTGLLIALDRRLQEGLFEPDSLAPVARLLGAGDIVLRSDLQYERFRTARPEATWQLLLEAQGLGDPTAFGDPVPNVAGPEQPLLDEITLATPPDLETPPPVAVFPVEDPAPLLRAQSAERPLLVGGGPEGLVDAAGAGLLQPGQPIFYAATFADDPTGLEDRLEEGAVLLLTDTNRRQARRWGALQQNTGYTERAGEEADGFDPSDNRLEIFPGAGDESYTVSEQRGGATVTATDYGNPVTYTADDRPANALDGDPDTAWRVGAFSDVEGERLVIDLDEPTTTDHVTVLQPVTGVVNRVITEARLIFDGDESQDYRLTNESEQGEGQQLSFPERSFDRLEIEILDTNVGKRTRYDGVSGVGFAEVGVGDITIEEVIRPPTDLLEAAGGESIDHDTVVLYTRLRSNPGEPVRLDEETAIRRVLQLPTARAFDVAGQARLSAYVPDERIDELVGLPPAEEGGVTARSSRYLPGSLRNRASAAIDGDPSTFWSAPFEKQEGGYVEFTFPEPVTFDHLDLQFLADGRHSVPTRLFLVADGDEENITTVEIPAVEDQDEPNAVVDHRAEFDPITATTLRVAVDGVRDVETIDWHSGLDIIMPIGIAEIGVPGVTVEAPPEAFDSGCRDDLLSVDDDVVPLRVTGTTDDALDRRPLDAVPCGDVDVDGLDLTAGEHVVRSTPGSDTGIDLDQVALSSAAGGAASPAAEVTADPDRSSPTVSSPEDGRVSARARVEGAEAPYWFVLGQSWSDGWEASIDGRSLGPPTVIDGYANGWLVDPAVHGADATISVEWRPQRTIWVGLALSAFGVLACLVLAFAGRRAGASAIVAQTPLATWPPFPPGPVPSRRTTALGVAGVVLVAVLFSPPPGLVAIVAGGIAFAAFRWVRGDGVQTAMAALLLGLTGLYIAVQQIRYRHPPDFIWPQQFDETHLVGLLVVFLLTGEVLREILLSRRQTATVPPRSGPADEEPVAEEPADPPSIDPEPNADEEVSGGEHSR